MGENEATTSRSGSVRGRGSASPAKTNRGGKGSPKAEIPKFSLDNIEEGSANEEPVEEESVPVRKGRKATQKIEEALETPVKPSRGRKKVSKKDEAVQVDDTEITPVSSEKPKRGRKAAIALEQFLGTPGPE